MQGYTGLRGEFQASQGLHSESLSQKKSKEFGGRFRPLGKSSTANGFDSHLRCSVCSGWKATAVLAALCLQLPDCLLPVSEHVPFLYVCALISTYKDTSSVGSGPIIVAPSYCIMSYWRLGLQHLETRFPRTKPSHVQYTESPPGFSSSPRGLVACPHPRLGSAEWRAYL